MCEVCENNVDHDGLYQVYPNYGYFQCITRKCKKCHPDAILLNILKENPVIMESTDEVSWDSWEWGPNERTKLCRLDKNTYTTPKKELIQMYLTDRSPSYVLPSIQLQLELQSVP